MTSSVFLSLRTTREERRLVAGVYFPRRLVLLGCACWVTTWFLFTVIAGSSLGSRVNSFGLPLNDPVRSITVSAAPLAGSTDVWLELG